MLLCAAGASAVAADWPATALATQPDPFVQLGTLQAGRVASSWTSLADARGCAGGQVDLSAHAQGLAESSEAAQDPRIGAFSLIDRRHRAQFDATVRLGCVFGQIAVQRQVGLPDDFWSWDGSALGWRIDEHWRVGVGRTAHQWGPGWDGSLILGSAARPFPNIMVAADSGLLPRSNWFWWLGEVDFSAFFGELEQDRSDYDRPYLMGARLVVRPWPWFELGASRTAMWGGEDRDNSLRAFWTALAGRDNQDGDTQPGNQLGGFDLRADLSAWLPGIGLYGQMIGEDEAASLPSKYMVMAGIDWRSRDAMAFAEWTDSTAKIAGVAYNHHIYTDGYRHRGAVLGHWADGDSNLWTVGGLLRDLFGGEALAVFRYGTLNDAGANSSWPNARLLGASLQWRTVFERWFGVTVVLDHVDLRGRGGDAALYRSDTRLRLQLEAWLP